VFFMIIPVMRLFLSHRVSLLMDCVRDSIASPV
jgi:hypothetical protein